MATGSNEPTEEQKKLWNLYMTTAGSLQACVEHKYTSKQCKAFVEELQKLWSQVYGDEYMHNAMKNSTNFIYFTAVRS